MEPDRSSRLIVLIAVWILLLSACNPTPTSTALPASLSATSASVPTRVPASTGTPEPTGVPASTPTPEPTTAPTALPTPEPTLAPTSAPFTGATITYIDPSGDCLDNNGKDTVCDPAGFDILTTTVSRPSETAPLYIILEVAGQGVADIPGYAVMVAFDFDRDAATGDTNFPPDHGTAPELEIIVDHGIGQAGKLNIIVFQFTADGTKTSGDSALVEFVQRTDNNLAVVISPELLLGHQFNMSADLIGLQLFDHIVDHGSLQFPEGTTALIK